MINYYESDQITSLFATEKYEGYDRGPRTCMLSLEFETITILYISIDLKTSILIWLMRH